jgi:hypothetical protein
MVVEGDWPGRMPKKAVVEKTKDQLSAQKCARAPDIF